MKLILDKRSQVMNAGVCENCHNEKTVNRTDNRLVTESCGHVKCMDCLLLEKSGCVACHKEKDLRDDEDSSETIISNTNVNNDDKSAQEPEGNVSEDLRFKKRPEISHIRIETDGNTKKYYCTMCGKYFQSRSQVVHHAYCNGQPKPFQCKECTRSFSTHSHFKYHMRVHNNERAYACDVCGDRFFQMSKLRRHKLSKHTNEKKHVCTKCYKCFNNYTALRRHGLLHTGEKPYGCAKCELRFRNSSNYKKHLAKHEEAACTCSICGREVRSRRALAAHARAHDAAPLLLPRRRHGCEYCPLSFHSGKDLRRHNHIHSGTKLYRCSVCSRRFRRKDNLDRHVRNTHPGLTPAPAILCHTTDNEHTNGHTPEAKPDDALEKNKLEILNPLPPLPQEVIQQCINTETDETNVQKEDAINKAYILEANIARQSVIVEKCPRKTPSPEMQYVHKIRRALPVKCQDDIMLPPIDMRKMRKVQDSLHKLDVGAPLPSHMNTYKNILTANGDRTSAGDDDKANASPLHWRKLKLNQNW